MDNGLSPEVNKLLIAWKKQIDENEKTHKNNALWFRKMYYMLGVPATILSGLSTAGALTILQDCSTLFGICVLQSCISALVTILIGIQTYTQMMTRHMNNKLASDRYQALSRTLQTYLTTPNNPNDTSNILNQVRQTYDDIVNTSPLIPSNTLDFAVFDRTTRSVSERRMSKNEPADLPKSEKMPRKSLPPASKEELEKMNKLSDQICIDIDLDEEKTKFRLDPRFQYELQRFYDEN